MLAEASRTPELLRSLWWYVAAHELRRMEGFQVRVNVSPSTHSTGGEAFGSYSVYRIKVLSEQCFYTGG